MYAFLHRAAIVFVAKKKGLEIRYLTPTAVLIYFLQSKQNEYTGSDILLNELRHSDR